MAQPLSIYSLITPLQILCPWMLRATSKSLLPQISLTCLLSHLLHLIFPNLRPLFSSPFGISKSTPIWPLSQKTQLPRAHLLRHGLQLNRRKCRCASILGAGRCSPPPSPLGNRWRRISSPPPRVSSPSPRKDTQAMIRSFILIVLKFHRTIHMIGPSSIKRSYWQPSKVLVVHFLSKWGGALTPSRVTALSYSAIFYFEPSGRGYHPRC